MNFDGIFRQTLSAPTARNFAAHNCADDAIDVSDWQCGNDFFFALDRTFAKFQKDGVVEGFLKAVVLRNLTETSDAGRHFGLRQNFGKIETFGLPMIDRFLDLEAIDTANHSIHLPKTELGHQLANFFGNHAHEIDDVLRFAHESLAQLRVLRRNTNRAGIQMANAHHDTAHCHEWCGGKTKFLSAEQRSDDYIATGFQLAIGFDDDPRAEIVQDERLMCLCQAQLPRDARVFDAGLR